MISKDILRLVLEDIMKSTNQNQEELALSMNYKKNYISDILSPSGVVSQKFLDKLNLRYPGFMENPKNNEEDSSLKLVERSISEVGEPNKNYLQKRQDLKNNSQWPGIPMFDVPFTASFTEVYRDETLYKPRYYLYDERFRDCDFGTVIRGDSMHSEIRHGDLVVCKEITDFGFVSFGEIYLIVTSNGFETCKYLHPGRKENELILKAYNKAVPDTPLPINYLLKLYKVRGIIRAY